MIEFLVLGRLELRTSGGLELRPVLSQPRLVALLAYLAVHAPGGYVRRDTLLGLFWPESDTEHARGSLRRALHSLRHSLGTGVVVARGAEEVGVDPARLACDAVVFERSIAAGAWAEALSLYRGDLLNGFYVTGAPEFEQWLESRRAGLREQAADAAWAQSSAAEEAGDAEAAVRFGRRGAALSRDEEPAVRRLIGLLGRVGHAAGALQVYEEFATRLARDYDLMPSAETNAQLEAVRAVPQAPAPLAATSHDATASAAVSAAGARREPATAAAEAGPRAATGSAESSPVPRPPRRHGRRTVALLGVLALITGTAVLSRMRPTARAPVTADLVAVLPFSYHGSPDYGYLGEGMVRLLGTSLDDVGELRTVDPRALLSVVERTGARADDPARASGLADQFGAGLLVLGHIIEAGGRLRITAVVYDRRSGGAAPIREATVEGGADQLLELVDDLTARIVAVRSAGPEARLTRTAALTTHSLPALRAFLEGEREYRAGHYVAAVEAFRSAIRADSTFALAHYRLSAAQIWTVVPEGAEAAERAFALSSRLPRRDSLLVEARYWNTRGRPETAMPLYEKVLADHPDDVEAWLQLGEIRYHWGPTLGAPAAEARDAFERVLRYEPSNAAALIHVARLAAGAGDRGAFDSLTSRLAERDPAPDRELELDALRAATFGDRAAQQAVRRRMSTAPAALQLRIAAAVAAFSRNIEGTIGLTGVLASQKEGQRMLAQLELARGRWPAARAHLDRLDETMPQAATQYRAAYATHPLLEVPRAELESILGEVADAPNMPDDGLVNMERLDWPDGIYAPRRLYLLGLIALRLGDTAAAARLAEQLEQLDHPAATAAAGRDLARIVRAQLEWSRGRPAEALQRLGAARIPAERALPTPSSYATADERWLRAELLAAAGRLEEALRWFGTFPDPQAYDIHYLAPSYLRRAGLHERRAEQELAADCYRRFIELWHDADPELQPLVAQAQQRLAAITGA